jgi:hypothetical protein
MGRDHLENLDVDGIPEYEAGALTTQPALFSVIRLLDGKMRVAVYRKTRGALWAGMEKSCVIEPILSPLVRARLSDARANASRSPSQLTFIEAFTPPSIRKSV